MLDLVEFHSSLSLMAKAYKDFRGLLIHCNRYCARFGLSFNLGSLFCSLALLAKGL